MDLIWLLDISCWVFTWWRHRLHRIWFQYFLDSWHLSVIVPAWSLRYCSVSVAWSMENFRFNSPFTGSKELWWLENHGVFISLCLIWGIIKRQWAYPNPPKAGVISWDRLVADLIFKGPMPGKNPYNWLMLNWMLLVLQPCWYAMGWWQRKIPGCFCERLERVEVTKIRDDEQLLEVVWSKNWRSCCNLATAQLWQVQLFEKHGFHMSVKMFFPTKLRRCIKDGYGTKVCTTSRVVFDVYFFAHLIWEAIWGCFCVPRHTKHIGDGHKLWNSFGGLDGMVFHRRLRPPNNIEWEKHQESIGWGYLHHELLTWFFNHGQMMQALKLLHGFLLFVILYSCFFDIPERLCEIKHTWLHGLGYGKLLNFQPQLQVQWNMSRLFRNPVQDPFC